MRTDTGLKDSYNEPIYEGDAIYDEVGGFFNYTVKHNGRWYASHNPKGDVLNGSIEGGYGRQCQVIHTDAETVVELWQTHRNRDLKEEQLQAKIENLELQLQGANDLIAGLQHDINDLEAEKRGLLAACKVALVEMQNTDSYLETQAETEGKLGIYNPFFVEEIQAIKAAIAKATVAA